LLLALSACAPGSNDSGAGTAGNAGSSGTAGAGPAIPGTGTAGASGTAGTGGTAPPLPPEVEVESSFEVPVATGHFIWVANPQSGRVAYVDASTLEVHTVEAGNAPTYMSPIPGNVDAVIVLNVLSDDATVLSVGTAGLESRTIRGVAHGANALAVSDNGGWAIAWTDARRVKNAAANDGYQDLTVINLDRAAAKPKTIVTAGFRPVSVAFAADGRQAFAVTEDGITVVDLTDAAGPRVTKNVIITDDPTENADTRDVSLTASGGLAIIRREGSAAIGIVDLATSARASVTLSGPVTDLDVTSDGKRAVAVVRNTSEVAILPLDGGIPPTAAITRVTITGEVVGSVVLAPGGGAALLYSNATTLERLTVLKLGATPSYRVVKLHAPVLSVFAAADAGNVVSAVVVHVDDTPPAPTAGAGTSPRSTRKAASPSSRWRAAKRARSPASSSARAWWIGPNHEQQARCPRPAGRHRRRCGRSRRLRRSCRGLVAAGQHRGDLRPDPRRRRRRRARRSRRAADPRRQPEPAHRLRPGRAQHPDRRRVAQA
jgi:hypothetical protein